MVRQEVQDQESAVPAPPLPVAVQVVGAAAQPFVSTKTLHHGQLVEPGYSDGKPLAPFGAAARQYGATMAAPHAHKESMSALALTIIWLKCTLHGTPTSRCRFVEE